MEPAIIVHGGAGFFVDERNEEKMLVVKKAVIAGHAVLMERDDPVGAVEKAVMVMEDDPSCNAGYGSVLNREGVVEADAMIIRGSDLATGGVGALKYFLHPISIARAVMDESKHALLAGEGAEQFAVQQGFQKVSNDELVAPRAAALLQAFLSKQIGASTETGGDDANKSKSSEKTDGDESKKESGMGTVGAVAINSKGEIAAATSTGGLCGKLPGRIGDTPIPGGGTFCDDDSCGISATGIGEAIMRYCLASKIANLIENGMEAKEASMKGLKDMTSKLPFGDGGVIVITKRGEVIHANNSKKMSWASIKGNELQFGVQEEAVFTEILSDSM